MPSKIRSVPSNYTLEEQIQLRKPSDVKRAVDKRTNATVNIKRKRVDADTGIPFTVVRELATLRAISHPNVARLLDFTIADSHEYVDVVYADYGCNLRCHVRERGAYRGLALKWAANQVISGVHELHRHGIVHRYLSAMTTLVDSRTGHLVISDFYLSQSGSMATKADRYDDEPPLEIMLGKPLFQSGCPYMFERLVVVCQVLGTPNETTWPGVSQLEYYTPEFPKFPGTGLEAAIRKEGGDSAVDALGEQGLEVLAMTTLHLPSSRPECHELLAHSFFYEVRSWPEVLSVARSIWEPSAAQSLVATIEECSRADWTSSFPGVVHTWLQEFLGPQESLPACPVLALHRRKVAAALSDMSAMVLSDAVALASLHARAEKFRMLSKDNLYDILTSTQIVETAVWYVQAFQAVLLPDCVIYRTVMMFARILQKQGHTSTYLMVATILAIKFTLSASDTFELSSLVEHLSHNTIQFCNVAMTEAVAFTELNGDVGVTTAFDFLNLLAEDMPDWEGFPKAKQAAEVVLQMTLADSELHFETAHLALAAAVWAIGLATCEEGAPSQAWAVVRAAMKVCGRNGGEILRIGRGISRCWKRRDTHSEKLFVTIVGKMHGDGTRRVLDAMQLGWPWLRAQLTKGLVAGQRQ